MGSFSYPLRAVALWVFSLLVINPSASGQQFSADLMTLQKGASTADLEFHLNVANSKIRMGKSVNGIEIFVLADKNTNAVVTLHPDKMLAITSNNPRVSSLVSFLYVDNPLDACPGWQKLEQLNDEPLKADCFKVGPDTVSGRDVIKYEVRTPGIPDAIQWVDPKLRFVIKSQGSDGSVRFLDNIQEGTQPPNLFNIPPGYQEPNATAPR